MDEQAVEDKFQTRDEFGCLQYFSTFREALEAANNDDNIWKISFPLSTGERIRLIRQEIRQSAAKKLVQFVFEPLLDHEGKELF